jgi:hypothetical protein
VADQITNIDPKMVPFLKRIGIDGEPVSNVKFEWQEDTLFALTDAVSTTTTMTDASATSLTLSGDNSFNFQVGDILLIASEQVRVTAVGSDDGLTISRAWGGTSGAGHAAAVTVRKVGHAFLENTDSVVTGSTIHSFPFNYAQIYDVAYQISHRAQQIGEFNVTDRLDYEAAKVLKHAMLILELSAFYGKRVQSTSTIPSAMGGLEQFITLNKDTAAEAITEKKINDLLALSYDRVGHENMPSWIVTNQWQKRKVADMFEPMARMDRATRTGGVVVDVIDTVFGEIDVSMVFNCPTDRAYFLNPSFIKYHPLKNSSFFTEPLPEAGAFFKEHLYGDYTFVVRADAAHGYMSNLTTS